MPLMYTREEVEGQIDVRVSGWWYASRYATVSLVVVYLLFGKALGPVVEGALVAGFAGAALVRAVGFWTIRRELSRAMKKDSIQIAGSQWNYKQPLRYSFRTQLPVASVVTPAR